MNVWIYWRPYVVDNHTIKLLIKNRERKVQDRTVTDEQQCQQKPEKTCSTSQTKWD